MFNDWILFNLLDFGIRNLWWIMGIKFTLTLQTKKVFATRIINLFTYVEIQLVHVSCKILSCSKLWTWRPKNLSSVYSSNVRKQNYILLVDNSLNHVLCKKIFLSRSQRKICTSIAKGMILEYKYQLYSWFNAR